MRIIYLGTPQPAADLLSALIAAGHEIVCIITQPDRPRGRGQKVTFSPVKEVALKHSLPIEQPERLKNNPVFLSLLQSLKPELGVVVAYGKILPPEILAIPKHGFINLHASLLPKYRGAAPIQWALLKGEKETGITIFRLTEQLDEGPIISQEKIYISEDDNAVTLSEKLFKAAPVLMLNTLEKIEKGSAQFTGQNEAAATFAPMLTKESAEIDWKKSASEIHDRIRALVAWPGAHTIYQEKRLKIITTRLGIFDLRHEPKLPGEILQLVKDEGFIVATGAGDLLVLEVQLEGGKKMRAFDFAIGHDVKIGETLPQ